VSARDLIGEALRGIRLHRVRALFTALGFAAGTAAAVASFAITGGARAELLRRLAALGVDRVAVRPVGESVRGAEPALTFGDAQDLGSALGFVREVAPVRAVDSTVQLPNERVSVRAVGTTPEFFRLRGLRFRRGGPFSAAQLERGDAVCVLGSGAARRLARSGEAYGGLVKVGGNWYRVVGVLAADGAGGAPWAGEAANPERDVYVPITHTFAGDAFRRQALAEAWLTIDPAVDAETAAPILERALERRHAGKQHFEVVTAARLLSEQRAARALLNILLRAVALGAFALGAVGMMTVSWQNVRDRRREIAIRRAIGARRAEVLAQFVVEGVLLAAAGALAGIAAGIAGSAAVASANAWPWTLSAGEVLSALAIAIGVAALSTLRPAAYAASLDPVAALRFEG